MRRTFEKSLCKCSRCVAKRRIRFLTLSGVCLVTAAGCFLLVGRSKPVASSSLNLQEASAGEPASNVGAVSRGNFVALALAQPETTPEYMPEDGYSPGSSALTKNIKSPASSRAALRSPDPIREAPMPHTSGWQTVPLADASKSESGVDSQGPSPSGGMRVAATLAESSSGPAFGEGTVSQAAEIALHKNGQALSIVLDSDPYELLPRWLKEMQQKPNEISLNGNELVLQNQKNTERGPESITASRPSNLVADPTSEIAKSNAPEAETNREPVITQIDTPEANFGETFESADRAVVAPAAISPTPAIAVPATGETAGSGQEEIPQNVAVVKTPELAEPPPAEPKGTNLASRSNPGAELLPQWLKEIEQKPDETSLAGTRLVWQNQKTEGGGLESIAASRSTTVVADPASEIAKSNAPETNANREPVLNQIDTPETASSETFGKSADADAAAPAVISPTPAIAATATGGIAGGGHEVISNDVPVVKSAELDVPLPGGPKEMNSSSPGKPDEPLASGRTQPPVSEIKGREQQPAETSAKLLASVESNTVKQAPEEWRKPRGYITIESAPETPRSPGAVDHSPKPQDNRARGKDRTLKVQDRPATAREYPAKVEEHPAKVPNHPSKPDEKSGDLRRFASAFLETDQTGNIADQHRFYADSVHFYREGDLSWTGVAAATRRYHQERQNKRYGTEGTAAVKGPVNGGFYVVEQPVTWSRAEGSRLTRGRSVLRLQVVPTSRGDWKITSIEEIGR
jgi:hypothetical protein